MTLIKVTLLSGVDLGGGTTQIVHTDMTPPALSVKSHLTPPYKNPGSAPGLSKSNRHEQLPELDVCWATIPGTHLDRYEAQEDFWWCQIKAYNC